MTAETREPGRDLSTFALDVYWSDGRTGNAAVEAHVAGCARCQAYLASLDGLQADVPAAMESARTSSRAQARRRWVLPAAGALALAAAVILFVRARVPATDGYVGVKGTPAVEALLVHRDHDTRVWDGRSPLHPGDAIALRVACEGLKQVVVAAPGPGGWARLTGAPCPPHPDALPFTLQVDDEPGAEKLAVVLSQEELDDATLRAAIAETRREADLWVASFVMPKEMERDR